MMLTIKNLSANYGSIAALRDISLSVSAGEMVALIGPNGAGKTTVIRAASGTLTPVAGEVLVNGLDISRLSPAKRARLMSVVPQARQMGGAYTVRQAVMMGRTAYMGWLGSESKSDEAVVALALQQANLEDLAERQIANLSGGEQQRVLLARALAQSTPVLLLDEPTNHLDLRQQIELLRLIRRLAHEKGLAVLMAMHDLNLVAGAADRVALLCDGRMRVMGTPDAVLTEENLAAAYQIDVRIISEPGNGQKVIIPRLD
jgi:iron complex transport system ATP-binding protein